METWDKEFEVVMCLVHQCGNLMLKANKERKQVEKKSCDVDLVTETDTEVERILVNGLKEAFPKHSFIGEEAVSLGGKCELLGEPTWIIDPVDGTMNFVHSFPYSAISIALYFEKAPVIAIIYNPFMNQMYTARKGKGSFLNGEPIHVSKETELCKALVMAESGTSRDPEKLRVVLANLTHLTPIVHGIRTLGSAALNMASVASGGADINFEFGIHAWDIAAGKLLVEEAGGVCIDPAGGEFNVMSRRVLCASTMELAQEIAGQLIQYYPEFDG